MDADLCIVGAGPAGLTLAQALIARGLSVLLLESGGETADARVQSLNRALVAGGEYGDPAEMRRRQVGGTVNQWNTEVASMRAAKYLPLDPLDFVARTPRETAAWPFGMAVLEPFYRQAQALCGLGRFVYDADHWASLERPLLPVDDGLVVSRIYQFGGADVFLRDIPARVEAAQDATLMAWATARRIETDRHGEMVTAAHVVAPNGRCAKVTARRFVLAAGAIENARLLLSANEVLPGGLGNRHDQVGRGFMEHPRDHALILHPADAGLFARAAFYDRHVAADGTVIMGRLALAEQVMQSELLLQASATLLPVYPGRHARWREMVNVLGRHFGVKGNDYPRGGAGWSAPDAAPEAFRLLLNLEQAPWPENRVRLAGRCDRFGVPMAEVDWRWRDGEQSALRRVRKVFVQALESAGLGRVTIRADSRPDPNAHHHAGTTRMSEDPRQGVVNADGRVHGVGNLYVAGASTFPCAGFANPMLSIVALSLRLARHLSGERVV